MSAVLLFFSCESSENSLRTEMGVFRTKQSQDRDGSGLRQNSLRTEIGVFRTK